MSTHQIIDQLKSLRCEGMVEAFEEQITQSSYHGLSFEERLIFLIDREKIHRENKRLRYRLTQASFGQNAQVVDLDFSTVRGVKPDLLRDLTSCQWINEKLNLILTGPTGIGKSYIASALGHQACLKSFKVKYLRIPRFFSEMNLARADGSYLKRIRSLEKFDLLILDDWGLSCLQEAERHDLMEIIENRHMKCSIIITSQIPIGKWDAIIGNPTIADSIMDRLIPRAHTIELKGESMRKKSSPLNKKRK